MNLPNQDLPTTSYVPTTRLRQRKVNKAVEQQLVGSGFHPLIARVIAARPLPEGTCPVQFLNSSLRDVQRPDGLNDIDRAAERIVDAMSNGETIGFVSDFDNDGQVALSVCMTAFEHHFGFDMQRFMPFIGERLSEGYGLSDKLCDRILRGTLPSVIITGDCGSSDQPRIERLAGLGCDVIVSDHHHFPEAGPPSSAYAVVSPIHPDSDYDPYIAGGMVTWLLMTRVRRKLIDRGLLDDDGKSMGELLDYVASATIADCVGMNSITNRAVVQHGLRLINHGVRPAWKAFLNHKDNKEIVAQDLAFSLGPMLNSDGRLSDAFGSVSYLLSSDGAEANAYLQHLVESNEQRKTIERGLTKQAIEQVKWRLRQEHRSIVVYLPGGHPGVSGIVASRLKEHFGRPSIVLAPTAEDPSQAVGSARGIDYEDFHCLQALRHIQSKHPDLLTKAGGHKGAAGLSLPVSEVERLQSAFEEACAVQLKSRTLDPVIFTDGRIDSYPVNFALVDALQTLEPTGRCMEAPVFEVRAKVLVLRPIGQERTHLKLTLLQSDTHQKFDAVWFNVRETEFDPLPVDQGQWKTFVGCPSINEWRGNRSVQFIVEACA